VSHIVRIQTQVRDPVAILSACSRLALSPPEYGEFSLFSGEVKGLAVRLSGWKYPLVCRTESGELSFDNYGGAWGEQRQLDEFLQAYAVEKARLEAGRSGHSVTEQRLPGGAIKLTVHVGGAA
jgi:hypothetical protein